MASRIHLPYHVQQEMNHVLVYTHYFKLFFRKPVGYFHYQIVHYSIKNEMSSVNRLRRCIIDDTFGWKLVLTLYLKNNGLVI